jgi:type II secretory pathway component GspD/PulD (secretin)
MDVPPQQVHIEAMILSVKLDDTMALGVNFALLNGKDNQLVVSGNGAVLGASTGLPGDSTTIVPQNPFSDFLADTAGLKYGFIRGDISAFVSALENLTDTNLIATPQLMVLNKQKAQLIIGDRLSYSTSTFQNNQSIQNVNFVDAGTKLSLRPFVANDGLVRMEIHPERSSAVINRITGLPDIATTEVTSTVMVRDGTTVVIGGLIEEQVTESQERIPFLGSLPVVGAAFRNKNEQTERRELIILITPRIVQESHAVAEADAAKYENERRAQHFQDELAPANRRNLTRNHYNKALLYYERGELGRARQHIREAARQNKHDRQVLRLQEQIDTALREQRNDWIPWSGGAEQPVEQEFSPEEEVLDGTELIETTDRNVGPLHWKTPETLQGN